MQADSHDAAGRPRMVDVTEKADTEYLRRLSDVVGVTASKGKSYGNTINAHVDKYGVPLKRSERLAGSSEPVDLRRPLNAARDWTYHP